MRTSVANLLDRSVRYLESGEGPTLILLHAFPLSADQWLPQMHRLPPGWRAIAPDLRGFRGSGSAARAVGLETATMDSHGADVLALMAHLDVRRAVIAGLSMGGYIAMALARRAPARVVGLVLANTRATPDSPDGLAARDKLIAVAERDGAPGVARDMLPKLLGATSRRDQPDLEDVVRRLVEANATDGLVSAMRAMKSRPDSTASLSTLQCPALIISGDQDTVITPADIEGLRHAMPAARSVVIRGAGHLSNLEAPVAFNQALAGFLQALPQNAVS